MRTLIPRYLDEPERILCWTIDEFAGLMLPIIVGFAISHFYRLAAGIPRVVNVTCDRALLGAYTQEQRRVTARLVRRAAGEVYGRLFLPRWLGWTAGALLAACFAAAAIFGFKIWQRGAPQMRAAQEGKIKLHALTKKGKRKLQDGGGDDL